MTSDTQGSGRGGWRHGIWPAIVLLVGAVGMIGGGVPPWRAVAIACGAAVALWSVIASMHAAKIDWYDDVPGAGYRTPTAWEVPGLAGARESADAFQDYLRPRLWALAQDLLRRRGVDPASERARQMVGPRDYALLCGADRDPRRTTSSVSALCQTIARLAVDEIDGSAPPMPDPALRGLAGASRRGRGPIARAEQKGTYR